MNCFAAVGQVVLGRRRSKNWLRPPLKSDMCVCMPEPFSPKSGFGMKVA